MTITYYISDGYSGTRPKYVTIPDEEIEECKTQEELNALVEQSVMEHFTENVSPYWDSVDIETKKQVYKK